MSFAYLALYTGDYLRDTRHLTPLKHGVYVLLLMHCWDSRGPVPLDEQECAGIANCRSADEIDALRYVLGKYFVRMDDGWYNARMQKEIEKAQAISAARSHAGFKGYEARVRQLPSKRQASASTPPPPLTPPPPPAPPQVASGEKVKSTRRATRLSIDQLPPDWGAWTRQQRPDLNPQSVFEHFRDYWIAIPGAKGCKLDWDATWRNWCRNQGASPTGRKTLSEKNNDAVQQWLQGEKDVTHG